MREFITTDTDIGLRADIFLTRNFPNYTRSSLEGLFDSSLVSIGNKPIKASYRLREGDRLSVDDRLLKQNMPNVKLPIIYEDDDVMVINKPSGVLSHSKGAINVEATVASFIKPYISDLDLASNRAGIVHRLDRLTSGVIITAKNQVALTWLQKQFSGRKTKKIYIAVVEGIPVPVEAIIDAPIARNPRKPQTFYANVSGKPSQTEYKLIKSFKKHGNNFSVLELKPLTGRTHQIRVHLAYIHHPVVGDNVYAQPGPHLMLHAKSLELTLPNHERKVFSAPIPKYFKEFEDV